MSEPSRARRALAWRAGLFAAFALTVALLGAWLLFGRGAPPIQTDLLAMLPANARDPLADQAVQHLAQANGDRMVLLLDGADDTQVKQAARTLGAALERSGVFAQVLAVLPPFDLQRMVAPYLAHRFQLLDAADRAALARPGYDPARALARHLNAPLVGNVGVPLGEDPFGWLQHFLDAQPWNRSPLLPEDDLLVAHDGGRTQVLLTATLKGSSYDDTVQHTALAALDAATRELHAQFPAVRLLRTGAVFYAASARAAAEHDVHLVSAVSTLGIALLLLWVFRALPALLLAFLSTAIGVLFGLVATLLVFGQIHLLTLVFGAALLGEAVDSSIQYLAARANAGASWQAARGVRQVRAALLIALGTSLLGYALLAAVPFVALRQMACFAISGMSAACLSVFWLLPALLQRPGKPLAAGLVRGAAWLQRALLRGAGQRLWLISLVLLAIAAPGWWRLGHDDDIHLLIAPPAALQTQQREIGKVSGLDGSGTQFWLVRGADAETTLEREETLEARLQTQMDAGRLQGFLGIAGMSPSLARQRADHALLAPLFAPPGQMQQTLRAAGLREAVAARYLAAWPGTPLRLQDWLKLPLATPFRYLWMGCGMRGCAAIVLPQGPISTAALRADAAGLSGVVAVDKAASVSELFGRYRRYASVWLGAALILVAGVFAARYGPRAMPRVLAPPLLGIALCLATLGYLHQPLTLFHAMALMLVLGVGANYAVFLREGEPYAAHRPGAAYAGVLLSALTALLSFGLLALSAMPALRHFGLTLLLGIGFTVLLAPLSRDPRPAHAANA